MQKQLKVAVIGSEGNFGKKRVRALKANNIKIKYYVDALHNNTFTSNDETFTNDANLVFADEDIALICIATPDYLKEELIKLALSSNKHVFVEKPLSNDPQNTQSLFNLAEKKNKILKVGYNLTFFPSLSEIIKIASTNKLGALKSFRLLYGHGGATNLQEMENWRLSKNSWGGVEVDLECHMLEFLFNLGIFNISSYSFNDRFYDDTETAIQRNSSLICNDGEVSGSIYTSWECWKNSLDINLWFENGYIYSNGLLKYIKYGQPGEKLEVGYKNDSGGPAIESFIWDQTQLNSEEVFSEDSIEIEFTDSEILNLMQNLKNDEFSGLLNKELIKNKMIAGILEK
jgi:predicted dehydrogenase